MTPLVSVEMMLGTSDFTEELALDAPDLSTPALVNHPCALSAAALACFPISPS